MSARNAIRRNTALATKHVAGPCFGGMPSGIAAPPVRFETT